ncbi:BTAD domain-containing putative transcriptional regulator [uncultured Nocardioides sp.]|uniref:ATP-binding protein n=1 Tax=uncultured Nocardioides sp. TaxID=198441 RepID=UPI0025D7B765|nr:BTAD domain-containing putative transcriptional regulator [uncultured Nocardioides sp.]
MPSLQLLDGVRWQGTPVPGGRLATLLSVLALSPSGLSDSVLVKEIWADDPPAVPTKALQVLVSRVRSVCGPDVVARYDGGYRLSLPDAEVDAWLLRRLVRDAGSALSAGEPTALDLVTRAQLLVDGVVEVDADDGPRAELLTRARETASALPRLHGLALVAAGRPADAVPPLAEAHRAEPDDTPVLLALLRSEAAAAGASAALRRYEAFRADLADRLGVDPDPQLQRLHRELLSADEPVRTGLRYDADALLGRGDDLARLRAAMASGRLTTVLGPGGIGKTRIAQVLAQESTAPRVHVIELVGVASGDDVVAEVGAALGVRGSVTSRHALTPAQQADVRGRIAQELDAGPALLVLDNCEHVLETVASLVAFLLATTRDLRVLATSRAPLRIGAERVVPLSQLAPGDAAGLFRRCALAVRPDAELDDVQVAAVVERLDGLPLAIELAAARLRIMSVAEVRRRLDDRFELLRSRDRGTPARHRTLTAVIEWSWDLLSPREQEALARMSVFHDGFDDHAAGAVLGPGAVDDVETLVDQSLLVVVEDAVGTRFRALETIREFAAARLLERGGHEDALAAQDRWADELADQDVWMIDGGSQFESIDRMMREENNLTDVLRRALARRDPARVARLVAVLGGLWTVSGNHPRVFAVADAVEDVLVGWDPTPELRSAAHEAASLILIHLSWVHDRQFGELTDAMRRWGEPETPWSRAAYAMFVQPGPGSTIDRLLAIADDSGDHLTAAMMLLWASLTAENSGDVREALVLARRGLATGPLTPYLEASLLAQLAQLAMALGDHREAARHAERAWPLLLRLHAVDDARTLRVATALVPLVDGDLDAAERILDELGADPEGAQMGSRMAVLAARAELALARGDVEEGLRLFDAAVASVIEAEVPGVALTPWVLLAAAGAIVARVQHTTGPDPRAAELRDLLAGRTVLVGGTSLAFTDLPLNGVLVVALGAWTLRFGDPGAHEDAVHLLAVADRWTYNRSFPSMAWPRLAALAETALPGRLDALREEYAGRPGGELVAVAEEILRRLTSSW